MPKLTTATTITDAAYRVLLEAKQPMHYGAIYEVISGIGIRINGKDPKQNLTSHMSQDARFKSLGKGIWGIHPLYIAGQESGMPGAMKMG